MTVASRQLPGTAAQLPAALEFLQEFWASAALPAAAAFPFELALEDLGPRAVGALPAIIETAGNPQEKTDTRRYANGVLRELGSAAQEAVPTLIETAQERGNDFMVRLTAIGALSAVGSELPAVSSALRALARTPGEEPEIREAAARASGGSRRAS